MTYRLTREYDGVVGITAHELQKSNARSAPQRRVSSEYHERALHFHVEVCREGKEFGGEMEEVTIANGRYDNKSCSILGFGWTLNYAKEAELSKLIE